MNPGFWGILVIAIAVVLLFGRGKISGMMGEVASGIKAFQKGMREDDKPVTPVAQIDARETEKNKDA